MKLRKLFVLFLTILVPVFSATVISAFQEAVPRAVSKPVSDQFLFPAGNPVPSFGDTIRYDDGFPAFGLWLPGEDVYWAMRFTPAMDCTLKEAHIVTEVWSGPAPTCTLIVWDDSTGEPGTPVFSTTFTPSTGMNVIDITSVITYPESTDFWIGYFLQAPAGLDTTLAGADSGVDYNERSGIGVSGVWYTMNDLGGDGDLVIRAFVEYYGHDVGTDSITSPPDTVLPESTYTPVAWVHNYGDYSETSLVVCEVDSYGFVVYTDTQNVIDLAPGGDEEVMFVPWTVPPEQGVAYRTCVRTLLPGDSEPSNDTLCTLSYAVTGVAEELYVRRPTRASLYQNIPNPFYMSTTILYEIPISGKVNVCIYDATGRLVRILVDSELSPGNYREEWNGRNDNGFEVPDGVYFCKLSMNRLESAVKLILIR